MTTPETPAAPEPEVETPPWGSDENFDPKRAWDLIEGLRADKEKLSKRPTISDEDAAKLAEFDKLKKANQTELDQTKESLARYQTEMENWRSTAVGAKVQAHAASDFADPDDAVRALDSTKYLSAGGEIDDVAIKKDLAALLEQKPHYRRSGAAPAAPRTPAPNRAQGGGGNASLDPAAQFASLINNALT